MHSRASICLGVPLLLVIRVFAAYAVYLPASSNGFIYDDSQVMRCFLAERARI